MHVRNIVIGQSERDKILSGRGLRILRFDNEEIRRDLASVLNRIAEVCRERISSSYRGEIKT